MIHRARVGNFPGPDGLVFTFFRMIRSEVAKHKADKVYFVLEGSPVRRLSLNPDYKGTRVAVDDGNFYTKRDEIIEICKLLPITLAYHPFHECDDVIAHLSTVTHANDNVVISSSDTDFIQIVSENVKLWNPVRKQFREPFENYVTWKAFVGDKSDNIPGVKGVGDKTAQILAKSQEKLIEFFDKKPELKELFDRSFEQIKFEKLNPIEELALIDYNYDEVRIREVFIEKRFRLIVDKGWKNWNSTWDKING